jgi:serralysin
MPNSDFNGDGRDDILWREQGGGRVGNWLATQDGSFATNAANSLVGVPAEWVIAGTGDFNNDGNDDILWYNNLSHQIGRWLGQDNGGYLIDSVLTDIGDATVLGIGDFDGRNGDDVLLLRTGQSGSGVDVLLNGLHDPEIFSPRLPEDYNFAGIGDFNGDDHDDLIWRTDDGTIVVQTAHPGFGLTGRGFMPNVESSVQVPTDWHIVGTGDFNGDGYDDILWRHDSGLIGNWLGGLHGVFTINNDSLIGVPHEWQVMGTGDYDGDGFDDILWRNVDNGAIGTWLGTNSGVFTISPEPLVYVSTNWLLQPNASGAGEWD